jgi:hypothetical protein
VQAKAITDNSKRFVFIIVVVLIWIFISGTNTADLSHKNTQHPAQMLQIYIKQTLTPTTLAV